MPERRGSVLQVLRRGYPEATFWFYDFRDFIWTSFVELHFADEKAHFRREMTQPKVTW